ncbi:MAG: (4Fe-4S)-binding protein [Desulfobulbaceae bacterium DB1]|nr:MAG: (4Fe-4S)-binding protein [Desulfobulbaceae bacterium DB1]
MKIAVASGKGGTGKTTVAVALACSAGGPVQYLDCDVEEPNGHIFLRPVFHGSREISLAVPRVLEEKCTWCGKCRDLCRFNAITVFGRTIMVFPDLCHACGGCFLVCPEKAFVEERRVLGLLEKGRSGEIDFVHGRLRVGEAMAVPLIHAVLEEAAAEGLVIIDAPPGTSCPFVASVKEAEYVLLVTEATPFGLHDLKIAVAVLRKLGLPFGVIINRSDLGDVKTASWCRRENITIHSEIPFDRKIAEGYAAGVPLVDSRPELRQTFSSLLEELQS